MTNVEELQRALDFPWEKWTVFLHPEQRQWVERDYAGPARVSGSAGTGKTIVALHRAAHLARTHPDARVLLTTFSDTLANALQTKLKRLLGNEPRLAERIDVHSLNAIGLRLYKAHVGPATIASPEIVRELMKEAASAVGGHKFGLHFLLTEWEQVVDAWQLDTWEAYRDVARLGRKTRLPEAQRTVLWSIFERVRAELKRRKLMTHAELFSSLAAVDLKEQERGFRLRSRGRSAGHQRRPSPVLCRVGRRSAQCPLFRRRPRPAHLPAALLLEGPRRGHPGTLPHLARQLSHFPPNPNAGGPSARPRRDRRGWQQRGPERYGLRVQRPAADDLRRSRTKARRSRRSANGSQNGPRTVCFRTNSACLSDPRAQLDRARAAVKEAGIAFKVLDEHVETTSGHVSISTMHLAKGLEFRAVVVMACDDEIIPLQERIETVGDDADLQEVYDTERHLLYVACTRARDHLLVTSGDTPSEFLDDLRA